MSIRTLLGALLAFGALNAFAGGYYGMSGAAGVPREWLAGSLSTPHPVDEMGARSGLSRRTLECRFRAATGLSPIGYVQQLRIREARRLLERTTMPVDEIGFAVGYLNTAYFRSLFRRTNRLGPGAYRRKFGQFRAHRDSNSKPSDR